MTDDEHAADAERIRAVLEEAGWTGTAKTDLGVVAYGYDNGRFELEVELERGRRELLLTLEARTGESLVLYPVYGDRLQETLEAIVAFQDDIDTSTLQASVAGLVRACPEVYVQPDEDGDPMLLEDDTEVGFDVGE